MLDHDSAEPRVAFNSKLQFINLTTDPAIEIKSGNLRTVVRSTAVYNAKNRLKHGQAWPGERKTPKIKLRRSEGRHSLTNGSDKAVVTLTGQQYAELAKRGAKGLRFETASLDPFHTFPVREANSGEVSRAASCKDPGLLAQYAFKTFLWYSQPTEAVCLNSLQIIAGWESLHVLFLTSTILGRLIRSLSRGV